MNHPSYMSLSPWSTNTAPTNYQDIVYLNNGSSYGSEYLESVRYPDRVRNASDMNQLIMAAPGAIPDNLGGGVDFLPEDASVQQIANKFQELRAFLEARGAELGSYDLDKVKSLALDFYCNVENPGSSLCTGPKAKAKEEIYKPSLVNKALNRPYLTAGIAVGSLGALFLLIRAMRGDKRKLLF